MKSTRMLGLILPVALIAMAFTGISTAAAESTALCEFDAANFGEVCPEGHRVTHLHETTLPGVKTKILTTINIECDVLFLGDTVTPLRAPLLINGEYTYTNCSNNCTVVEENKPSVIKLLKILPAIATVTLEFLIKVSCPMSINCSFKAEAMPGTALDPLASLEENGEILAPEKELTTESGTFCPKASAFLDLKTTPLDLVYIAK